MKYTFFSNYIQKYFREKIVKESLHRPKTEQIGYREKLLKKV